MNCEQTRSLLPEHLYGESPAAQQEELNQHLAQCPVCADAYRGLQNVRRLLDAAPVPAVQVDLPLLYQQARALDNRRLLRWRRLAWVSAAAAAVLLVLTLLRFEVRWQEQALVIGWGLPPAAPAPKPPETPAISSALLADLQLVKDLIHSMVADMDERQQDHAAAVANFEQRLEAIQSMSNRRWTSTQNDFRALYTYCAGVRDKGAIP